MRRKMTWRRLVAFLVPTTTVVLLLAARLKSNGPFSAVPSAATHSDPTLLVDDSVARAVRSRGRLLCWIPSVPENLGSKVKAVNDTWTQRCDKHLFFIEGLPGADELMWDVVSLNVSQGRNHLTAKSMVAFKYLYQHHLDHYDWFLKGDDDAYIIVENLRYLLDQYDPGSPVYLGHLYKRFHKEGYMSGGASYVLSREALRLLVKEGIEKNQCRADGGHEDAEVGKCLHAVGVHSHNTRDRFGRDSFHPLRPHVHIAGPIPANQLPQDHFTMLSGHDCCSQLTISFHKVDPVLMKIFDHLLYRTSVYGRALDLQALDGFVRPGAVPTLPST